MSPELINALEIARTIVVTGLVGFGLFFLFVGAVGLARLPDFYTRLHGAGVTDTLGAELILFGLMLQSGWSLMTAKLAIVALFLFITSPTATHAIANAAYFAGLKPVLTRVRSGGAKDTAADEDAS